MKTNSAFQTSEAIADSKAANFFKNLNYIKTTDPFDTVDFFITVKGNKWVGETKVRTEQAFNYPDFILEAEKFKSLKERMITDKCNNAIYINFFGDTALLWDYNRIIKYGKCQVKRCKRHSAVASDYVDKQVIMLPKDKAVMYKFNKDQDGKWTLFSKPLIK